MEPQDILSASATSVPACARDLNVLYRAGCSACRQSARFWRIPSPTRRGDLASCGRVLGAERPLARMSGAQDEP